MLIKVGIRERGAHVVAEAEDSLSRAEGDAESLHERARTVGDQIHAGADELKHPVGGGMAERPRGDVRDHEQGS